MAAATFEKLRSQAALQLHHRAERGAQLRAARAGARSAGSACCRSRRRATSSSTSRATRSGTPTAASSTCSASPRCAAGSRASRRSGRTTARASGRCSSASSTSCTSACASTPTCTSTTTRPTSRAALKRLASIYDTRVEELDDLLRREIFVDLLNVVRQGLRISHPRYGLKNVEQFFFQRKADLRAGDDSIVLYEQWRLDGEQRILDEIEAYNEEDCEATWRLREWLLERKAEAEAKWSTTIEWREPPEAREPKEEAVELRDERDRLRAVLLERGETLAARLLDYHRREAKPAWWAFFARLERTPEELIEDAEAIGGLEHLEDLGERTHRFRFPVQQHKLDRGDAVVDPVSGKGAGTIETLDDVKQTADAAPDEAGGGAAASARLVPGGPYDTTTQQKALLRFARSLVDGDRRYPQLEAVLRRDLPLDGERVQVSELEEMKRLVERVEGSHLFVQGPPGSGKTWTAARLIVHLIARGKRVGVTSQSHESIHNLLREVERVALAEDVEFVGLKKGGDYEGPFIHVAEDGFTDPDVDLVAGTAWLIAKEDLDSTLDYLFVDEAGQISLADALAMGTAARTIVLFGDPLQLAQVTQGLHPDGSGASVLEHLLGEHETIPEDRGLFLEHSRRMHPDVCRFISDAFYESRLSSAHDCERQTTEFGTGLRFVPVEHEANRRESQEEAQAIRAELRRLLGAPWTDAKGVTPAACARRRPCRCALQRPSRAARGDAPRRCARRDGRQVPGAGGGRRVLLDDDLKRRRPAAQPRLPLLAQPSQRRRVASPLSGLRRRQPAPARDRMSHNRADADGERALSLRRAGGAAVR